MRPVAKRIAGILPLLPQPERRSMGVGLLVLVGYAPTRTGSTDHKHALMGRAGQRIAELAGVGWPYGYLRSFDRVNLLEAWPGSYTRGGIYPGHLAREAASDLVGELEGRRLILIGQAAGQAFGLPEDHPALWWTGVGLQRGRATPTPRGVVQAAILPAPQGSDPSWADPAGRGEIQAFLRDALELAAGTRRIAQDRARRPGTPRPG